MARFEIKPPKEPSERFTTMRWYLAQVAWFITEKSLRVAELSESSLENIRTANELLENHSAVFYMNHVKYEDVMAIGLALKHLTNAKNLYGPAGLKHFDKDRDRLSAEFYRYMRHLHIVFLPVLQKNDREGGRYTADEIALISNQLRVLSEEALSTPGNVLGITPEGTRYEDNILRNAYPGIGFYEQYHQPSETFYLPFALQYPPHTKNRTIHIGKPQFLPEILDLTALPEGDDLETQKKRAKQLTQAHMVRLAQLLPPHLRGAYKQETTE